MRILFITLCLSFFGLTFSQTTFIVTTANGQPAVGADVYKSGNVIGKTDENGKFTIEQISKGDTLRFLLNLDLNIYTAKTDNPKKNQKISLNLTIPPPAQEEMMGQTVYMDEDSYITTQNEPDEEKITKAKPETVIDVYMDVDENAEFPGGNEAMRSFIKSNLINPNDSFEGKCYLRFKVMEDGSIDNITIMRGVPNCPECDKEAVRLLSIMPKWKPAKVDNKNVSSFFDLPINFKQ